MKRRETREAKASVWCVAVLSAVSAFGCSIDGVVGGSCAAGYTACGSSCIPVGASCNGDAPTAGGGAVGGASAAGGAVGSPSTSVGGQGASGSGLGGASAASGGGPIAGGAGGAIAGGAAGGTGNIGGPPGAGGAPGAGKGGATGDGGATMIAIGGASSAGYSGTSGKGSGASAGAISSGAGGASPTGGAAGAPADGGSAGAGGSGGGGAAGTSSASGGSDAGGAGGAGGVGAAGASAGASAASGGASGAAAGASGAGGDAGSSGAAGTGGSGSTCPDPLVACGGACVDLASDEVNCGACFAMCATGVCQSGGCVDASVGHRVLIGVDFASVPAWHTEEKKLLGNATFLGAAFGGGSWRVLGLDPFSSPSASAVDAAVLAQASPHGVTTLSSTRVATTAAFLAGLSKKQVDVVLVYDQSTAPTGALAELGLAVKSTLGAFTKAGGVVVVLAGNKGPREMWAFAAAAGVAPTNGLASVVTPSSLIDAAPGDAVGQGVATFFSASPNAVTWTFPDPGPVATTVLKAKSNDGAVIVHAVVDP